MATHILGIRHHGPGSARNIARYLADMRPDIILVEGPPEAENILGHIADPALVPPVAILAYVLDDPQQARFYPIAEFSPEWQAMRYASEHGVPLRFCDLPLSHDIALDNQQAQDRHHRTSADPFDHFAAIEGLENGEAWWDLYIENRLGDQQVFEAIAEAVSALRSTDDSLPAHRELLREAWMRKTIRQAEKEGFQRIAVICGAWHVPALEGKLPPAKQDLELLKHLPKVKIACTWIPWTYNRLTFEHGYGAGLVSPGWYDHLWHHPTDDGTRWVSRIARLLRQHQLDVSVAHVVETVRLAAALATIRQKSKPGLAELTEAVTAVIGFGSTYYLQLIETELITGDKIGQVPDSVPKVPLLADLERQQKTLRLPPNDAKKELTLDLRQEHDLLKSKLLHRLTILDIHWGQLGIVTGKGTFKEVWALSWQPEFSIRLIEMGNWGNTIEIAAQRLLMHQATQSQDVSRLTLLIGKCLLADLPDGMAALIRQLDLVASHSQDALTLMSVFPELARSCRYGNVRKSDADLLYTIAETFIIRFSIGLPHAAIHLSEEAANHLLDLLAAAHAAVLLVERQIQLWHETLGQISSTEHCHPLISGYCTRLLLDLGILGQDVAAQRLAYSLSKASNPTAVAYWIEGLLKGSGQILLRDEALWALVFEWVEALEPDAFVQQLPLLRRAFGQFSPTERAKIGLKIKSPQASSHNTIVSHTFDAQLATKGIQAVLNLLYPPPQP